MTLGPRRSRLTPDRRAVTAEVHDVGRDVPAVLAQIAAAGGEIADVDLAGATLHDVFIALTGRELRE